MVYVPCVQSIMTLDYAKFRLRTTRDERFALIVYSELDRLHTCVGPDEPWLVMPTERMATVRESIPFDLILLDIVVPQCEWTSHS